MGNKNMGLEEFLVTAKKNTYVSNGEGGERKLEDGSRELVYEEGEFRYKDRYLGFDPFVGEEIVWRKGKVVWAMNYYGAVSPSNVLAEKVYKFLKKAMAQVEKTRPFRGPNEFLEGQWKYIDKSDGSVNSFEGIERIYFQDEKVYELKYHGGKIGK